MRLLFTPVRAYKSHTGVLNHSFLIAATSSRLTHRTDLQLQTSTVHSRSTSLAQSCVNSQENSNLVHYH